MLIEIESSKKKDRLIKRHRRGRLKLKERNKVAKEATQELEEEIQQTTMQKN